jgi:hypothetical protein
VETRRTIEKLASPALCDRETLLSQSLRRGLTRIAAMRATNSPMTRLVRSISSFSRIGPLGAVAHIALMHSRVRDKESTTA